MYFYISPSLSLSYSSMLVFLLERRIFQKYCKKEKLEIVWVTIAANRATKMTIKEAKHSSSLVRFPSPPASFMDSLREGKKGSKLEKNRSKCIPTSKRSPNTECC